MNNQKLNRQLFRSSFLSLLTLLCRHPSVRLALVLPLAARARLLSRFGSIRSATSSCDSHVRLMGDLPSRSSPLRLTSFWKRCRTSIPWPQRPNGRGNQHVQAQPLRLGSFAYRFCIHHERLRGAAEPRRQPFGGKANGEIGLATRAMAALNSNDVPTAIDFAERAVQKTPNDAGFRALLGNAYFAGGRFQSAEQRTRIRCPSIRTSRRSF